MIRNQLTKEQADEKLFSYNDISKMYRGFTTRQKKLTDNSNFLVFVRAKIIDPVNAGLNTKYVASPSDDDYKHK